MQASAWLFCMQASGWLLTVPFVVPTGAALRLNAHLSPGGQISVVPLHMQDPPPHPRPTRARPMPCSASLPHCTHVASVWQAALGVQQDSQSLAKGTLHGPADGPQLRCLFGGQRELGALAGAQLQLRFVLQGKDTRLYAFDVRPG